MFDLSFLTQFFTKILSFVPHLSVIMVIALVDFITITRAQFIKIKNNKTNLRSKHDLVMRDLDNLDYSILIPIFGDLKYLKNVEYLAPYGSRVILCTTSKEKSVFDKGIDSVSKKYGFRVFRSDVPLSSAAQKPNPWRLFNQTLIASQSDIIRNSNKDSLNMDLLRDEIIRDSFEFVKTKYCIFLDGDTVSSLPLDILVKEFIKRNLDISSVRVLASKTDSLIEKLQSLEYEFAMDAREVYPWLTSGASMVARTEVIKDVMKHHSLFFQGGDIEIGKLSDMMGYKVGHIPFEFFTDVPETFKVWFKQRVAWSGGGFRHAVINFNVHSWRYPMFFLYMTVLVYAMTPVRWYEIIVHTWVLILIIIVYWLLILFFRWRTFKPFYILFPFYALVQVMVVIPLGVFKYFLMVHSSKNIGLIKNMKKVIFKTS